VPRVRSNLFDSAVQVLPSVQYSYAQTAAQQFDALFNGIRIFDNPKPYLDLAALVEYLSGPEDIVLDFFAGSGSIGHAVLQANQAAGSTRRFILVQLPEKVNDATETGRNAIQLGIETIADITRERIRRVARQLGQEEAGKLDLSGGVKPDRGFRVFKLAESNFTEWDARVEHDGEALEKQLELHIDHIRTGRSEDDIFYELLLKSGFPLSSNCSVYSFQQGALKLKTESLKTENAPVVYSISDGALMICLEKPLTLELIRAIADAKPERVVCLDAGFVGNDQLKTNAVQTFRTKGVTSFKTV
jgi:adenine-specific DNA-methyltransferase